MNTLPAVLLVIAILICSLLLLSFATRPTMDAIEWNQESYTVKAGDSLWSISADYCPDGVDRREWVEEVRELNCMDDSTIYPGQKITVLVPAE